MAVYFVKPFLCMNTYIHVYIHNIKKYTYIHQYIYVYIS